MSQNIWTVSFNPTWKQPCSHDSLLSLLVLFFSVLLRAFGGNPVVLSATGQINMCPGAQCRALSIRSLVEVWTARAFPQKESLKKILVGNSSAVHSEGGWKVLLPRSCVLFQTSSCSSFHPSSTRKNQRLAPSLLYIQPFITLDSISPMGLNWVVCIVER